jgi:glutathione synthase/RimK-type ligase-like ATP-grasp enzyme
MQSSSDSSLSIVIFCTSLKLGGEPISSNYYWEAYLDLLLALKDRGVEAYFATDNNTYLGGGLFSVAYTADTKIKDPKYLRAVKGVKANVVFERAESDPFQGKDVAVINPEAIRRIANNKIAIYQQFPALQPASVVVNDHNALIAAIDVVAAEKVVVKEPDGYGGEAVYIGTKTEVLERIPTTKYPLLVQEFVDTSGGVPGYGPGVHDVRLEICGGQITCFYIRQAQAGQLHSNVHLGGTMTFLPTEDVPTELVKLVAEIDQVFAPSPRFYAADFAHSRQGWRLIELNDYVGLARLSENGQPSPNDEEALKTLGRLADYLVETCCREAARRVPALLF